jgi:PAS domain S-box-containing protein
MKKQEFIEKEILKLLESWGSLALLFGSGLIMLLSILDYFVTPENFEKFLLYRAITATLFLILYSMNKRHAHASRPYLISIFFAAMFISSVMVELMVFSFGGHKSIYYVGMLITIVFTLGFIPFSSIKITSSLAAMTYFIYILPIIAFDTITNFHVFLSNSVFLGATMVIAIIWRYYNDKLLIDKLSFEFELSRDKEQLQQYSTKLKELVAQRTEELAISEQKYRALFENASDGVVVFDTHGIITNMNQKFCELHGFTMDSLVGTNVTLLGADKDEAAKKGRLERIVGGESLIYETRHFRKDGSTVLFEVSAKSIDIGGERYIQAFYRDISEKKRMQEQLFQSQKMESVGMLAGGLAHDFNNIIMAILGHVELLSEFGDLDAEAKKKLAVIESSARKANQMISKLLRFARKESFDAVPIDLNAVVEDSVELIGKTMTKKGMQVATDLRRDIPFVRGDSTQLEQVIMNLLVNASDAMTPGGVIRIETSFREIGYEAPTVHPMLVPGRYVILRVSDTGTGIPEEVMDKIYDPFFTTKEKGKGTGLGLAMVYGIVKEHGGVISASSQVGKGTTFEIYLPAESDVREHVYLAPRSPAEEKRGVMVVDDNKDMLQFVSETIRAFGYEVIAVNNAISALHIFREKADEISLIVTDIFMPVIDGRDLIRHFKSIKPSIKVIAISGYQLDSVVRQNAGIDDFIKKPFSGVELMSRVHKLIPPFTSLHS